MYRWRGEPGRARHAANRLNAVFGARLRACLFLRRSLQKLSLQVAPRHRPIASLWRARVSIALMRGQSGVEADVD
jgi:hypothetical protein